MENKKITKKISLFDAENKPIDADVQLVFEDVEKRKKIEKTAPSNKISDIDLGNDAPSGFWTITAKYNVIEATASFLIESEELAEFSLNGDALTITNVGNTRYAKTIQIIIGETVGIKKPVLEIGESITFRLIAPGGNYNVRITDGTSSLIRANVPLTGEVIGILDERLNKRTPITGIGPENPQAGSFIKQNKFVYVFVLAVVGATILLAIERHYRKRAGY